MSNIEIVKEIDLKNCCFNLKSKTTGKFSVNDSYRENMESGFLTAINAPTDPNSALKDIYYATERGLIISYKDFNNKILDTRRVLMTQNFVGKDIKDLSKEERIKLETESAKKVLKDLYITEVTKLFYSPEFTSLKEEYSNDSNIKNRFNFKELKASFIDSQKEDKEKERLVKAFLDFSDEIKPIVDKVLQSYNLDDLELTIIDLDKKYNDLPEYAKDNLDLIDLYNKSRESLVNESNEMKTRQNELETTLNKLVDTVIESKNFKNLKKIIEKIESKFYESHFIKNDTKSNSIKDTVIDRLKNAGKLGALISLQDWNETNFKTYDFLITQNLNLELETLLQNKYSEELVKKEALEQKLTEVNKENTKEVFEKFFSLEGNKDLITKFFEIITEGSFEPLYKVLEKLEYSEFEKLLLLLANKVHFEKFKPFWYTLSGEILNRVIKEKFAYESINKLSSKDLYFETLIDKAEQEMIEYIFYNIKKHSFRNINADLTEKILLKLRSFTFELEKLVRYLYPEKLLQLLKYESLLADNYIRNSILRTLGRWMPALKVASEEFREMILNYPEYGIYNLRKKQAEEVSSEFILEVIDKVKNQSDLSQFLIRVGKDKVEEALKYKYELMAKNDPSNFDNQYTLGLSYLNEKNYEEAVSQFKRALGINPESAVAHFNLGFTYDMMGKYDLALASYKKANQQKYNYIEAMYNLGLLYSKMKDHFLAMQQFKKILKIEPNHYESCIALGLTYDDMGDIDNALLEYDKAITIDPEKQEAYINKAVCLSLQNKYQESLDAYDQILVQDPNNPVIHFNMGVLYQKLEEYAMANAHYKISARLDPKNGQPFNNIGLVLFAQKKIDKAIQSWEKSIGIDNNIDAYNNLGWGLLVKGDFDRAVDVYQRAKKINPKHAVLSLNLGTVYYRIGEVNSAIKELEEYLALEPNSENSFEVIKIIQSLKALKE